MALLHMRIFMSLRSACGARSEIYDGGVTRDPRHTHSHCERLRGLAGPLRARVPGWTPPFYAPLPALVSGTERFLWRFLY
jgi:hypothetical protein